MKTGELVNYYLPSTIQSIVEALENLRQSINELKDDNEQR